MFKWFQSKQRSQKNREKFDIHKLRKEKVWRINPLALVLFVSRRIWFVGVFIYLARFVNINWEKCVDFTDLTGYNLLFILFILMLLLPLLSGLKLSALGVGMEATAKTDSSTDIFERIKKEAIAEDITKKTAPELLIKLETAQSKQIAAHDANITEVINDGSQ